MRSGRGNARRDCQLADASRGSATSGCSHSSAVAGCGSVAAMSPKAGLEASSDVLIALADFRASRRRAILIYLIFANRGGPTVHKAQPQRRLPMTYATVMVSLALDQPNEARLQVAGELAERFEAAIVGVAAAQFAPPLYFTDGAAAQGLIDQEEASIKRRLADLEAQFRAATR